MKEKESPKIPQVTVSLPSSYWDTLTPEQQASIQERLECGVTLALTGLAAAKDVFVLGQTIIRDVPPLASSKKPSPRGRKRR